MNDKIIRVYPLKDNKSKGRLFWQGIEYSCALGEGGVVSPTQKAEGDGATPVGLFPLRCLYYRNDKLLLPKTPFFKIVIKESGGWCDDVKDENYNKAIILPAQVSHEKMYREDDLYNVVIPLGYNDGPIKPHKGSAIFFHIAHEGLSPTKGCVAISQKNMLEILKTLEKDCLLRVYANPISFA